jgi:hypothetical protein
MTLFGNWKWVRKFCPPVDVFFSADSQYNSAVINTNVIVMHTGEVVWLSHGIFRSSCDINVEYFPFDVQSCNMKWASWTYDGYQVWNNVGTLIQCSRLPLEDLIIGHLAKKFRIFS